MNNAQRIGVLVAAVVALAVAFVVLSADDDDDVTTDTVPAKVAPAASTPAATTSTPAKEPAPAPEPTPEPEVQTVEVRDAKPVDGIQRIEAEKGDRVRFAVRSPDTTDEIHVHGYDLYGDVKPGTPARFSFKADAEGIFEVELHGSGEQIAELRVAPD